jgi:zinc D-Ala-D-Ala carboxypeptidase
MSSISKYFTRYEVVHSQIAERLGLSNEPARELWPQIMYTAQCMDRVRETLGFPVLVSSWFRSEEVNTAIGSRIKNSQHARGQAVDFSAPGFGSPVEVIKLLVEKRKQIHFDQLIFEHSWIHISFCDPSVVPRDEVLTLLADGGYAYGITNSQGKKL